LAGRMGSAFNRVERAASVFFHMNEI
jgi:hypothetical protein